MSGSRKYGNYLTGTKKHTTRSAKFHQMFAIDGSLLDVNNISAYVANGVLVVSAPKIKKNTQKYRRVPINHVTKATFSKADVDNVQARPDEDGLEISEEEDIKV
eukprot:533391_1